MSFSKAKIQRFNDIKSCAPGPTAYNVTKDKQKTGVLPQAERLVEHKSPSISETGSTHSTPCFKTPNLLKKKKTAIFIKSKPRELFTENSGLDALKEKIVECENKDAYIKDLTEQVEEIKEKMSVMEKHKIHFDTEKIKFEETINNLKEEHENFLKEVTDKFKEDIAKVDEEKQRKQEELLLVRKEYEKLKEANREEMANLKENCDKFCLLYDESVEESKRLLEEKDLVLKNKENELKVLEANYLELQRIQTIEIEKIKKEHLKEIQDIEFEMLKTMTELQKEKEKTVCKIKEVEELMQKEIFRLKMECESDKAQMILDAETKIKQMEKTFDKQKVLVESELKQKYNEMENTWQVKLADQEKQSDAILKECQAISEYNIIQCELEKNEIKAELTKKSEELQLVKSTYDELVESYEQLNTKFKEIQHEFSKVIVELNDTRKNLDKELFEKNKEYKIIADEKRAYEVTIKHSQVTIDVLKRRLMNSDKDVEQLKKELTDCEEKILEYENKCLQLTDELKQMQVVSEELEMQYESAIKLNISKIQNLEVELKKKVDDYKVEVENFTKKSLEEEELSKEIMQQLHSAFEVITQNKNMLTYLETVNNEYEFKVKQAQNELDDYHIREIDWCNQKEKLANTVRELEDILELKQSEAKDLKKQIIQLQEKNETYHQYSEYYKHKVTEYERELEETGNIHKKYIEQSGKYDQLLQRFEQLEMEHELDKNKLFTLSNDVEEKQLLKEKYEKQKEICDKLTKKCEQLEKENSTNKKMDEEQNMITKLNKMEIERDILLGKVDILENELKDMSNKYAELAGHQNNKQRIKHVSDLKSKNDELVHNNMDLESKLRTQQKSIEKLKKENSDLKKCLKKSKVCNDDKENIGSPNRSMNSSRIESPFRERN